MVDHEQLEAEARSGSSGTTSSDDLSEVLDELALHAREGERLRVVALADRAPTEQAGLVTDDDDRHVGPLHRVAGSGEA